MRVSGEDNGGIVATICQQQKSFPALARSAKTKGSKKNTALEWHVESGQSGRSGCADPTEIMDAEFALPDHFD
jgi:hypothetical protein